MQVTSSHAPAKGHWAIRCLAVVMFVAMVETQVDPTPQQAVRHLVVLDGWHMSGNDGMSLVYLGPCPGLVFLSTHPLRAVLAWLGCDSVNQ